MKKLKCIVVDDEAIARKALSAYIEKVDELELIHTFRNGMEAKAFLSEHEADLLLLDINMPFLNGLELLRVVKNHPPVIFTTAYPEHALESFEFNVVDYLVKPIPFERFLQAVNKALRRVEEVSVREEKFLILKEGASLVKVRIADISFIEAMQNYIRIYTPGRSYTILMTMKEAMAQLPEPDFYQTHRSYIVQLNKVERIAGDQALIGTEKIPISKRSKVEFQEKFRSLR
ncbi:MAG: response regulator transcription factor [Phaeodactylibacter sp.]|nr:response regulator transcription factor [Phaeodactylibacter sp.]